MKLKRKSKVSLLFAKAAELPSNWWCEGMKEWTAQRASTKEAMKLLDLAAIRARCDAATRGPWSVSTLTYPNGTTVVDSITGAGEPQWCDYGEGEGEWFTDSLVLVETDAGVYGPTMPDAQFIAAARTDIPALLAYVEELAERALTAEERLEQRTRERDEARAQLAATDTDSPCDGHRHCCADRRKLAEELLRVRAERDALKGKL
jgi:hypothetical protein